MFKIKNLLLLNIFIFILLRLFLITNNNSVMAMTNNNSLDLREKHLHLINEKKWSLSVKKQEVFILSASCSDPRTKSILDERYNRYINMIKNLEEQNKSIFNIGYYNNSILNQLINDFNQQLSQLNRNY